MARTSFTFKSTLGTTASVSGSFLQPGSDNIGTDDSSALKADGYTTPPSTVVGTSFLEAVPTDYDSVTVSWGLSSALESTLDTTPRARKMVLTYSLIGPPQTLGEGLPLVTVSATNYSSEFIHHNLPSGAWVYYSLFVKYEATTTRSWYEKVASTEVLVPKNYGSTDALYRRIPLHYRLEDQQIGATNVLSAELGALPTNLQYSGPLYRSLEPFGWEIDVLRTTIDYIMQQKDPFVANTEMLDQLATEIGLPLNSQALGAIKLRDLIANYGYFTQNEGLPTGVEEFIASITGCNTEITFSNPDLISATQYAMSSVSTTTSASAVPSTNQWLLEVIDTGGGALSHSLAASTAFPFNGFFTGTNALSIIQTNGTGTQICCLKTKIQNVSQASRMYMGLAATYGASTNNGASVLGCLLSTSVTAASSVALTSGAITTSPTGFVAVSTDGSTSVFDRPITFGVVGNGALSTTDAYLHIWVATNTASQQVYLIPNTLTTLNQYPYNIDVYSQRLNIVRDPQFVNGVVKTAASVSTAAYWRAYETNASSSVNTLSVTNRIATITTASGPGTFALSTRVNNGGYTYTPIRRGVDYYFSIDDIGGNITSVSIDHSTTNTGSYTAGSVYTPVVTTSTVYKSETLSGGGSRKWWKLSIPNNEPWYPLNNYVYHLTINFTTTTSTESLIVSRPLLEPYLPGEYFDGNSDNGGWLSGSGVTNSDYRWGGGGTAHTTFSYYTSDYKRSVSTAQRMIDYIVPVTESAASASLRFNRIPGYTGSTPL